MKARDLMTENPECVTREDTLQRAAEIMRDHDVGIVPVVEDRGSMRVSGVITDRDITVRHVAEKHSADCKVGDHMSTKVHSVGPDDDADRVFELMKREQIRRVAVVEGGDRLVGIIAQADVATEGRSDRKTGDVVEKISEPSGRR